MVKQIMIETQLSIRQAMARLNDTGKQILIVHQDQTLVGVVTDGDVRRFILAGGSLDDSVLGIMNTEPVVIDSTQISNALAIMSQASVRALPVVNQLGQVVDLLTWDDLIHKRESYSKIDAPVVIMAGGKGTRLYPYTKILPKPLIPIDEIPIVERIMLEFKKYGMHQFFMTVNYRASMIKSYFDDTNLKDEIMYIEEPIPLGTAGSLKLIANQIDRTFFLSNCDILVRAQYADILNYHNQKKNLITVVSSVKNVVIPYGVIKLGADESIDDLIEKPSFDYLVNTGFYVLEPEVIGLIPENEVFHMTDLIRKVFESGDRVGVYPISEDAWMDMGQITEMKKMIAYFERTELDTNG